MKKYNVLECKISNPLERNMKIHVDNGAALDESTMYERIVGSLIYLTITQ